jgi:hypothetical protein
MKRLLILLVAFLAVNAAFSQSPNQFKYQAVLRDASGNIIASQAKAVEINILQGSATGTSVFTETHNVTTTAQGIINLNIGSVNTTGIAAINWATNTYFIKITVDGVEMGTSQLLSVPYSLNAKNAENFSGTITKSQITDFPVNATITVDGFMSATDKTKLNGLQNANIVAGTGISVTGTYPNLTITNTASGSSSYYVGQLIGTNGVDGVVFYVDNTGQHGLICSKTDIDGGSGVEWSSVTATVVPGSAISDFNGSANTTAINAQCTTSAASLCLTYTTAGTTAGTWYLPSIDELSKIYHAKYEINKALNVNSFTTITTAYYWSSTEYNGNYAWSFNFNNGYSDCDIKGRTWRVRAVRAF